jgi:hypothetical protein
MRNGKLTLARFAVVGFGPLILVTGAIVSGLLLNGALILTSPTPDSAVDCFRFIFYAIGMAAVLVFSIRRAAKLFEKEGTWLRGAIVLYGSWLLPAATIAVFLSAAMAGVSMAVVDGAATDRALRVAEVQMALKVALFSHMIIIPWVSVAALFLRRG